MLNKNMCKKCYIDGRKKEYPNSIKDWEKSFNGRWERDIVLCPFASVFEKVDELDIDENPPDKCPYVLEGILLNEL